MKKYISFILAIVMVLSIVQPIHASSISDEENYYEQIEELANKYGYDVEFTDNTSTVENYEINSSENSYVFTLEQLEIILSDLQELMESETVYGTLELQSESNKARISTYTKYYTDIYNTIALLDYYRLACQSSADYTYMYFQGLPRFIEVDNIDIHYVYISYVDWIQTGTRYDIFPIADFGDSVVEIISEGYNRIDCSVALGPFSIPIILTGESTILTYGLAAYDMLNN